MDLGTVRQKMKGGPSARKYKTLFQVGEDVRLVWTNCMTYNADGSDFYKLADNLHKKWDDKYTKLLHECSPSAGAGAGAAGAEGGGGAAAAAAAVPSASTSGVAPSGGLVLSAGGGKVTLQEKRNFAKSLFTISKEDLGRILVEVEAKCPAAITRNSSEDEVELNVDQINSQLLHELTKFVENAKSGSKKMSGGPGPAPNKKAKTG